MEHSGRRISIDACTSTKLSGPKCSARGREHQSTKVVQRRLPNSPARGRAWATRKLIPAGGAVSLMRALDPSEVAIAMLGVSAIVLLGWALTLLAYFTSSG